MENTEKILTPDESLRLISRTIADLRGNYRNNNFYFILWGWIISLASTSQFIMIKILLSLKAYTYINLYSYVLWGVFFAVAIAFQFYHRSKNRLNTEQGSTDKYFRILWQTSGLAMIFSLFICLKLHIYPNPFILMIAGLSTVVSGRYIHFRPLIIGGIAFFLFALAASFYNNEYQLLIGTAAIIVGYLVPGYMLQYSKE